MNINQFKIKLKELESNLENKSLQNILNATDFDLDGLRMAIKYYNENISSVEDPDLLNTISKKVDELISYSNNSGFQNYSHQFINAANFLINNTHDVNLIEKDTQISAEAFSQRYDTLISFLNPLDVKSNLILTTKAEQTPFELYRNNNNSIAVKAGEGKTPLSFTKERLISIVYKGLEATHHTSYSDVIIERILDNSIFEFITETSNAFNTDHMPDARIRKLEDERLKTLGKLKELEDKLTSYEDDFNNLNSLHEQTKNVEQEFQNAKEAVLKDIELQKSYKFWESKSNRYNTQYYLYIGLAIVLSAIMLWQVHLFLTENKLILDFNTTNQEVVIHTNDNNQSQSSPTAKINSIQLWEYIFLFFVTTMVIWLIKILVKITLSNYHLSIDAGERVIMIRTYLALLKEGKGFDQNDNKVILDNIFRPTNFGIIKDETSLTITDIISSLKK